MVGKIGEVDADVTYEQLSCLALEGSGSRTARGNLQDQTPATQAGSAPAGSLEYVAFWAGWDNKCKYTYAGTVPVRVHDITRPTEDLCYVTVLPVDLSHHRASCETPKISARSRRSLVGRAAFDHQSERADNVGQSD